jgi:hypothetical protein
MYTEVSVSVINYFQLIIYELLIEMIKLKFLLPFPSSLFLLFITF